MKKNVIHEGIQKNTGFFSQMRKIFPQKGQDNILINSCEILNYLPIKNISIADLCIKYFVKDLNIREEFVDLRDNILIPKYTSVRTKTSLTHFWDVFYTENSITECDTRLKFCLCLFAKLDKTNIEENINCLCELLKGGSGIINDYDEIPKNSFIELIECYLKCITEVLDKEYEMYFLQSESNWDDYDKCLFIKDSLYRREFINSVILKDVEVPFNCKELIKKKFGYLSDLSKIRKNYEEFCFNYKRKKNKKTFYSEIPKKGTKTKPYLLSKSYDDEFVTKNRFFYLKKDENIKKSFKRYQTCKEDSNNQDSEINIINEENNELGIQGEII